MSWNRGGPVDLRAHIERTRQRREELARLYAFWAEQDAGDGSIVVVGEGSTWTAFDADAELLRELGFQMMRTPVDGRDVPYATLLPIHFDRAERFAGQGVLFVKYRFTINAGYVVDGEPVRRWYP